MEEYRLHPDVTRILYKRVCHANDNIHETGLAALAGYSPQGARTPKVAGHHALSHPHTTGKARGAINKAVSATCMGFWSIWNRVKRSVGKKIFRYRFDKWSRNYGNEYMEYLKERENG